MVKIQTVIRHFYSPFHCKEKGIKLNNSQIKKTLAVSLPLLALGIIPGVIALYAISGVMLRNAVKKNANSDDKTVSSTFQERVGSDLEADRSGRARSIVEEKSDTLSSHTSNSVSTPISARTSSSRSTKQKRLIVADDSNEEESNSMQNDAPLAPPCLIELKRCIINGDDTKTTGEIEDLFKQLEASFKDESEKFLEHLYADNPDFYYDLIQLALKNYDGSLKFFFNEDILLGFLSKYSDVDIIFSEDFALEGKGKEPAVQPTRMNKTLLANCFDYFKLMFESDFKEASCKSIEMNEVNQSAFLQLLKYRLFGTLEVNPDNFQELAAGANYLSCKTATRKIDIATAELLVNEEISIDDAETLFEFADQHQMPYLQSGIFAKMYKPGRRDQLLNNWAGRMKFLYFSTESKAVMLSIFLEMNVVKRFANNTFEVLRIPVLDDLAAEAALEMPNLKKIYYKESRIDSKEILNKLQGHLKANGGKFVIIAHS